MVALQGAEADCQAANFGAAEAANTLPASEQAETFFVLDADVPSFPEQNEETPSA